MARKDAARIGFLGAGRMASALAGGWINAGLADGARVIASDPIANARTAFTATTKARATEKNAEVIAQSDVVILAVKPQSMSDLLSEIRSLLQPTHLVVSIAAGITIGQLETGLGSSQRVIRVMPNTPCLVGASASAFTPNAHATETDIALIDRLMNAVGRAFRLPEKLLDAVTGLSGSGPGFVYVLIEAMIDGGVRVGLPREVATVLAAQTVYGAAKMVLETGSHPGVLKDMVASAGGTTIAGLHALERGGVRAALMDAVEAATKRSGEMSKV